MSGSYDKNSIRCCIKICVLLPFPSRQSITSCICSCTSQLLSNSTMQTVGVDGLHARQILPAHVLLKQETSRGVMLQLGLSASSLDSLHRAGKARLHAQPGSVSIFSLSVCSACQVGDYSLWDFCPNLHDLYPHC